MSIIFLGNGYFTSPESIDRKGSCKINNFGRVLKYDTLIAYELLIYCAYYTGGQVGRTLGIYKA
jgi:hypothetical protein